MMSVGTLKTWGGWNGLGSPLCDVCVFVQHCEAGQVASYMHGIQYVGFG